tara:strand:+ start:202 stop:393 length:192 start_codon:yes stop_codon:yes gene_type:complete
MIFWEVMVVSRRTKILSLTLMAWMAAVAQAEVKSGLQVGDYVDAFDVKDCSSGLSKGKTLCYR